MSSDSSAGAGLDEHALSAFLRDRLEGDWDRLSVRQFVGGQSNPTFLIGAGESRYVLRKKPPGVLLPSAHAIDREFRVIRALEGTDVPVPRARLYCDDPAVVGTAFFVMDYVDGRVLRDPALPDSSPGERRDIYGAVIATLAALHRVDVEAVGLADFGRPSGYYGRQIRRWTDQYRAAETDPIPAMERLIAWLPANLPDRETVALVHGDFRLENMIVARQAARIEALLDWELSTLGDPLADLAYHCLPWHLPPRAFGGLLGTDQSASGIPSEPEYLARYCALTGRDGIANWPFYVGFAAFRLAAILQGVLKRAMSGNAASPDATERGTLASVCADAGWRAVMAPAS